MKALIVWHLGHAVAQFSECSIKALQDTGYEVHVAANFKNSFVEYHGGVDTHNISFWRNPFSYRNVKAYFEFYRLLSKTQFDLIHCNSPVGGLITRLVVHSLKVKPRVVYTAHGFHFFVGAPIINWLLYFPVEWILSFATDALIAINLEDYSFAKRHLRAKAVHLVPGIGINLDRFSPCSEKEKVAYRNKLAIASDTKVLTYVGELSYRKNQTQIIRAMENIISRRKDTILLLVGTGDYFERYSSLTKELGLDKSVIFLGYREDIPNILGASDIIISTSRQEGLPVSIMEAMAFSKPVIATDCRGNRDLVQDGISGILVSIDNIDQLADKVNYLLTNTEMALSLGAMGRKKVEQFCMEFVYKEMCEIYGCIKAGTHANLFDKKEVNAFGSQS